MWTQLYWIDGPWPGRLAVAARPRGGDWIGEEVGNWQKAGITSVLSLLTPQEERDLDLQNERREVKAQGIDFTSLPIPDRDVPNSEAKLATILEKLERNLSVGKNVLVHCRQGIGRSGLVAACLLVTKGWSPGAAVEKVTAARHCRAGDRETKTLA